MTAIAPELIARFRRDVEAVTRHDGRLAIALSGGPDSLSLLLLATAAFPGRIEAATVDHRLRLESADEAALAASHCAALEVRHETLPVTVLDGGHGLQAAARAARYAALAAWMARHGLVALLTAHHADDQAETLLMRLVRGSGVAGLAGVRASVALPAAGERARIYRPLLGWQRRELAAIAAASGLEAVDDPSNRDERFDRPRLRSHLAGATWLDPAAIARSATALGDADEAIEWATNEISGERIVKRDGIVTLQPAGLPAEICRRLVLRCITAIRPEAAPRGEAMTALLSDLRSGNTVTLAGIKCRGGDFWCFEPAAPRRSVDASIAVTP